MLRCPLRRVALQPALAALNTRLQTLFAHEFCQAVRDVVGELLTKTVPLVTQPSHHSRLPEIPQPFKVRPAVSPPYSPPVPTPPKAHLSLSWGTSLCQWLLARHYSWPVALCLSTLGGLVASYTAPLLSDLGVRWAQPAPLLNRSNNLNYGHSPFVS